MYRKIFFEHSNRKGTFFRIPKILEDIIEYFLFAIIVIFLRLTNIKSFLQCTVCVNNFLGVCFRLENKNDDKRKLYFAFMSYGKLN